MSARQARLRQTPSAEQAADPWAQATAAFDSMVDTMTKPSRAGADAPGALPNTTSGQQAGLSHQDDAELLAAYADFDAYDRAYNLDPTADEQTEEERQAGFEVWKTKRDRVASLPANSFAGLEVKALTLFRISENCSVQDKRLAEWDGVSKPEAVEEEPDTALAWSIVESARRLKGARPHAQHPSAGGVRKWERLEAIFRRYTPKDERAQTEEERRPPKTWGDLSEDETEFLINLSQLPEDEQERFVDALHLTVHQMRAHRAMLALCCAGGRLEKYRDQLAADLAEVDAAMHEGGSHSDAELIDTTARWFDMIDGFNGMKDDPTPEQMAEADHLHSQIVALPARTAAGALAKAAVLTSHMAGSVAGLEEGDQLYPLLRSIEATEEAGPVGQFARRLAGHLQEIDRDSLHAELTITALRTGQPRQGRDDFAATVAAFQGAAPAGLCIPDTPTDAMLEAGAAGIDPEQARAIFTAMAEAYRQEAA